MYGYSRQKSFDNIGRASTGVAGGNNSKLPKIRNSRSSQSSAGNRRSQSTVEKNNMRTPLSVRSSSANRSAERECFTPKRKGSKSGKSAGVMASHQKRASGRVSAIGSRVVKDMRPLTDKSFQQVQVRSILDFLRENQFSNESLTTKHFPLSSKDFIQVFNFLHSFLDPDRDAVPYTHFEDRVLTIVKEELRYTGSLTKSNLVTIGSLHSWPTVLGALSFLKEKAKQHQVCMLNMTRRVFPKEEDDEPGAPSKAQMVFDQQVGKFDDFLKGREINEDCSQLRQNLLALSNVRDEEMVQLDINYKELSDQVVSMCQQTDRLGALTGQAARHETDLAKMVEHVQALEQRVRHADNQRAQFVELIQVSNDKLKEVEDEWQQKGNKVSVGSSAPEVNAQLQVDKQQRIWQTDKQITTTQEEYWQLEVQFHRKLANLEQLCSVFNSICIEVPIKSEGELLALTQPELRDGVFSHPPSMAGLQQVLTSVLDERSECFRQHAEEVHQMRQALLVIEDDLKKAEGKVDNLQIERTELEEEHTNLKAIGEIENGQLDKAIAERKQCLADRRSTARLESDELQAQVAALHQQLEQQRQFVQKRKLEGKKFLEQVIAKTKAYVTNISQQYNEAEQEFKEMKLAKQNAIREALEELEQLETEIAKVMQDHQSRTASQ